MYIKKSWITLFAAIAIVPLLAFTKIHYDNNSKKDEVKQHILKSYIHGAFNELNPDAMEKGFHPEFAIFGQGTKDALKKYPISKWVAGVKKRKAKSDFNPEKNKWKHKFASVDVTGNTAAAELYKKGKQVYTDYLSLYKYPEGWKIVAKVYHKHKK